jgi:ribonucleoside-diphosphate reductase alpha chain
MINIDTCNEALPKEQKALGLEIKQSNLCSEITLATNEERTAVCCLSSVNLEYFDDWSENPMFI